MRSFDLVDFKVGEAEFFLNKMASSKDMFEVRFLFSAFVSAVRSITFCLQATLGDAPDFKEWYELKQDILRKNEIAKFFLEARNVSQKVGVVPISSGSYANGKALFYFDSSNADFEQLPQKDVVTVCDEHFKLMLRLIYDCYVDFGVIIDPHQYYTKANYHRLGQTIDDLDEHLLGIRGYTSLPDWPEEDRWQAHRNSIPGCRITSLFNTHLDLDKPHPPLLPQNPLEYDGQSWIPPCLDKA